MLLVASSNVGSAMQSFTDMLGESCEMSCSSTTDDSGNEGCGDHEDKDCCQDNCPCTCCVHLVFYKSQDTRKSFSEYFFQSTHSWNFNYFKEHHFSVFHPPLV